MSEIELAESVVMKAAALKRGDRVALVAPAGRPAGPLVLARCMKVVDELGLVAVPGRAIMNVRGSMAGRDGERAEDFNNAVNDESIRGIICLSGGWGSLRLLEMIDLEELQEDPKVIIGGDDNTALLAAIHARTGLVVLCGPNLDQINRRITFDRLAYALMGAGVLPTIDAGSAENLEAHYTAVDGKAFGRTLGGNLTALVSLIGTPYEPNFTRRILFFEDRDEQYGILDRWFTNLYLSGKLADCAGVAFGQFARCGTKGSDNMLSFEDTFSERLIMLQKPSCFGLAFGQVPDTHIVPIGVQAYLDCGKGTLEFLEPAFV